jgi:predicted PurR-regulated permease PerM
MIFLPFSVSFVCEKSNMIPTLRIPAYIRIAFLFIAIYIFIYTLYIGQEILIPIACSLLLSILLAPLVRFLVRRKLNRVAAIGIALVVAFILLLGFIYFIASQLSIFNTALPMMREKYNLLQAQTTQWLALHFNISVQKGNAWFDKTKAEILSNGNAFLAKTILTISGVLILVFLIPVYVAMILYYEPLLLVFGKKIFQKEHHQKLEEVLILTKKIVQSYLNGLLIEAVIVSTMNATALLLLGIDYAILLGILGGLLNMIPFIGGIVAVALPVLVALFTKDSAYYALMVIASYSLIQFIDNHYITPKIVASKVRINALVAVIVVLIGNALWGIPGMFMALPVTGILKVIFEHIDVLKPWAYLLGDTMPTTGRTIFNFSKKKKSPVPDLNK